MQQNAYLDFRNHWYNTPKQLEKLRFTKSNKHQITSVLQPNWHKKHD